MVLAALFPSVFRLPGRPAPRRRRSPRQLRLCLELLEDRLVPSVFTVTDLGDAGVGSGLQGDLRYAINTANANPDLTNRIVFQPGLTGTITLTQGLLEIDKDLEIDGSGEDLLTISGNDQSGVFDITADPRAQNVRLADLTVAHGTGILHDLGNGNFGYQGGGIFNDHANLSLTRVAVDSNSVTGTTTVFGGGIYNGSGSLVLDSSAVVNNTQTGATGTIASGGAGGIYSPSLGSVTLTDTLIANNQAFGGDFTGGIVVDGSLTVLRCTFTGNVNGTLTVGGPFAVVTITNSTFTGNPSQSGLFLAVIAANNNTTITDSTITNNGSVGVRNNGGELVITGCTIAGNNSQGAPIEGGGVSAFNGDTQIINSTIADNVGGEGGGGIWNDLGTTEVTSSTITGNRAVRFGNMADGGGGILVARQGAIAAWCCATASSRATAASAPGRT